MSNILDDLDLFGDAAPAAPAPVIEEPAAVLPPDAPASDPTATLADKPKRAAKKAAPVEPVAAPASAPVSVPRIEFELGPETLAMLHALVEILSK